MVSNQVMMEQRLKERLVGLSVLVVVAVIFLPMILTDPPETEIISGSNIPKRPEKILSLRTIPAIEAENKVSTVPNESSSESNNPKKLPTEISNKKANIVTQETIITENKLLIQEDETQENKVKKAVTKQRKIATDIGVKKSVGSSAWIIQLGSFTEEENAQILNKKLRENGYKAFVEPLKKNAKISYRVRVGPTIKRSEADLILKKLKEKMQIVDGIVVSYLLNDENISTTQE